MAEIRLNSELPVVPCICSDRQLWSGNQGLPEGKLSAGLTQLLTTVDLCVESPSIVKPVLELPWSPAAPEIWFCSRNIIAALHMDGVGRV